MVKHPLAGGALAGPDSPDLPAGQLPEQSGPRKISLANETAAVDRALREPGPAPRG